MTKDKDKQTKDFSHVETDAFRVMFIDNIEKVKELGKEFESSTTLKINLNDDTKDEVLYIR